ncbi:hypothetical protein D7V91_09080 [bacterium 1xD42-67]|nr:hypothetical protein D7V91_09080 [bacterium 1xD42-67]
MNRMEAGTGSGIVRGGSLKIDKQKRQHPKARCWRNKANTYYNSDIYYPIIPEAAHESPILKLDFFSCITSGKGR